MWQARFPPLMVVARGARRLAPWCLLVVTVFLASSSPIKGDAILLGGAGQFAVLHLGCGDGPHGQLKVNTGTIAGDVGIAAGATGASQPFGFGKFQKGFIAGMLVVDSNASSSVVDKNFTVTAGVFSGQDLRFAVDDAISASAAAAALPAIELGIFTGGSLMAGVYHADAFDLNKTTLTITGGPFERLILNVSGPFDFHQSEIVLQGGITADNVLFNVLGTGDVVTVGHSESIFLGDLLAVEREIIVSELGVGSPPGAGPGNAGFLGRIIGGQCTDLILHSGAQATRPATHPPPG